jgi:hypothetical protein
MGIALDAIGTRFATGTPSAQPDYGRGAIAFSNVFVPARAAGGSEVLGDERKIFHI